MAPPRFTQLAVIHDCGRVLATFVSAKGYVDYKDDDKRWKIYKKLECVQCGEKINWNKCLRGLILETRIHPVLKIPLIYSEDVSLSGKDKDDLGKPEKPEKPEKPGKPGG